MEERVSQELGLLEGHYAEVNYEADGRWVLVSPVDTTPGWSRESIPVAFQIPPGYPGTPPYGFFVPAGLVFNGQEPRNFKASPPKKPPFDGQWSMFSWAHDNSWRAAADLVAGTNLLNWVRSFRDRFKEGA